MAIQFKKQIAKAPKGALVSPQEPVSKAELDKIQAEYRKSDHYKHKQKNKK